MDFIAHIRKKDGAVQTVQEHLDSVRRLSEIYGAKIGVAHLAGMAGMLHDLGKNTEAFKEYIQAAVANPSNPPKKGSIDHSTAGGKLLHNFFHNEQEDPLAKLAAEWMAMCIISHHGGLRDFLTPDLTSEYLYRVSEKEIEEFEQAADTFFQSQLSKKEFEKYFNKAKVEAHQLITKIREHDLPPITCSLIIKYIFSCLIDADRTNTRMFENQEVEHPFDHQAYFQKSYIHLMRTIDSYAQSPAAEHPINRLRSEMSVQCEQFAFKPSGIYTLSIPTGGGKTLASLRYALKHATQFQKERIIYIVPYTTIIEQNAQQIREVLQDDEHILEHHSNIIEEKEVINEAYDVKKKKLALAKDNWDSPIIFTTMVQFLNVFYSKGTRNARRMHNLANSILIFDEVQAVPSKCISLFNEALNFMHMFGNSSIVLCTATQPALNFVQNKLKIPPHAEMVLDLNRVSKNFKRVNVLDKTTPTGLTSAELKLFVDTEMENVSSLLVILNTKLAARRLFEQLKEGRDAGFYKVFHLSTSMCSAHRKDVLREIKQSLKDKQRVVCVSTQLIEAGVDISFECVIRSLAGLDSIAQAAGRCNRHGKDPIRNVYIITAAEEDLTHVKEIKVGAEVTRRILYEFNQQPDQYGGEILSPEALQLYFYYYFDQIKGDLHYWIPEIQKNAFDLLNFNQDYYAAYYHANKSIVPLISRPSFATAEKYFKVIDQPTTSVLVPYNEEAKAMIYELNSDMDTENVDSLLKRAQQYAINIYRHELDRLDKDHNIDLLLYGNSYALKEVAYTCDLGLDIKGEGDWNLEII